ncbi:hypothetical protein ACFQ1E_14555 [Sphingomonas canadensis]|uniref:Glycosyltransferase RgtA/B/C/D-like domain-containing protein n=1 Tax=Sphingomonas canadensis TaxID=1219257 RepID=A0ABW3H9S8_9SPHN|nr:hypothetical protein [Sphingomonas canadensis]MCW3837195.1 hypothetical protein [Sphingomonas canadensis]
MHAHPVLRPVAAMPRWAQLALAALVTRAVTFGNPMLHVDETFYLEVADAWLRGIAPYSGVWDRKPAGLFLLYAIPAAFGVAAGVWLYQAMAAASAALTALAIARLADRAGWTRGATWAGVAYLVWLTWLEGQGGQAPVFYNLPMAGAVLLVAPGPGDSTSPSRRFAHGLAAMALAGLAIQIKYTAVFEGMFLGLWLMWREWRLGQRPAGIAAKGVAWAAVALAPTGIAWAMFAAAGHGGDWVFANFTSILARQPDPAIEQAGNLAVILLIASPLIAMAVLAWRLPAGAAPEQAMRRFLFCWLGAAALGLLAFGSWFDHYALPLLVPLCAVAAGCIGGHRDGRRWALGAIALFLIGGQAVVLGKIANRGTAAQYAALVRGIGRGPGCLYVYSGPSMLYAQSGRCAVTRYWFPSHLGRVREAGATGVDQAAELRRIFARARPEVVVMRGPYRGENAPIRAIAEAEVARAYAPAGRYPLGDLTVTVYRRK